MKKSTKRCLMLAIVIAIVTLTVSCVSAISDTYKCSSNTCNGAWVTASLGDQVKAQCEEKGFTWLLCDVCGEKVGQTNWVDKLGHKYAFKDYTLDETGKYYQKNMCCSREDCNYGFDVKEPELDGNYEEVKYCKVNFINDFVAKEYEDEGKYYATLAKTYEQNIITEYVEYPAEGSKSVSVKKDPVRIADKTFGGYTFAGWLTEDKIAEVMGQTFTASLHDTQGIMSDYTVNENGVITYNKEAQHKNLVTKAKEYEVKVDADTPVEYTLHAIFEVNTNVMHRVTFVNYDGKILDSTVYAPHGLREVPYTKDTPLRPDNIEYIYTFKYWALPNTDKIVSNTVDSIPPVYSDLTVMAFYHKDAREYNFKYFYYDKDKNLVPFKPELDVDDTVTVAAENNVAVSGKEIVVPNYFDAKYTYKHIKDQWEIPARGGYVVDLNHVMLPAGTLDNSQIDYITLVPHYQKILRYYKLPVSISYEDDNGEYYHPEKLKIEVRNADNRGIVYTEVVYDRLSQDNGIAFKTYFDVNYSSKYVVTVTTEGYSGTKDTGFYEFDPNDPNDDHPGDIHVILTRNVDSPCNCICHTFFKPIWVGMLNLLNSLFKAEFVCCDDMFANIGPQLNYGPARA